MSYQGDPRLILTADGADMQFNGGQPVMDRGLENLALISLFTGPGWCGDSFLPLSIGSSFEEECNKPITLRQLDRIRNAAELALNSDKFGNVTVTVRNPQGYRLEVSIAIERAGSELILTRDAGAWYFQTVDPAYRRI